MPTVGFERKISAGERPQTYSLDRAATGTGFKRHVQKELYLGLHEISTGTTISYA